MTNVSMAKARAYTADDLTLIKSLVLKGDSSSMIGHRLGRHRASIADAIRRHDLPPLASSGKPKIKKYTGGQLAVIQALWKSGLTAAEIGKRVGRTKNSIIGKLNRTGSTRRTVLHSSHPQAKVQTGVYRSGSCEGQGTKGDLVEASVTLVTLKWMGNTDGRDWQEGTSI